MKKSSGKTKGIEKSYAEVSQFTAEASLFEKGNTKLAYAIKQVKKCDGYKKFQKDLDKIQTALNEEIQKTRIELASEDDKHNLVIDEKGNYAVTRQNAEKFRIEVSNLNKKYEPKFKELDNEPCDIEPYFATSLPVGLTLDSYEAFRGIVISEEDYKKFIDNLK